MLFCLNDTYCRYYMKELALIKLGQIVRLRREQKNLTQHQLADKAGVDRNYIGMVERGERNPSYLSLLKISQGLDLSLEELLTL